MSKASRRQKTEAQLRALEDQFSADLVAALRECAAERWGLFGRNDAIAAEIPLLRSYYTDTAEKLIDQGEKIARLQRDLGYPEASGLFVRFLEYRQMHGPNSPGEPKLARQFLRELGVMLEDGRDS